MKAQMMLVMQELLPGVAIEGPYGPDPTTYRTQGVAGGGWEFVGLDLKVGNGASKPFMAYFGQTAVPVVPIEPSGASCLSSQEGEADGLEVFHSLALDGFVAPSLAPLKDKVVGSWFSASGNVGAALILGANGQYIDLAILSGTVPVNSYQVEDVFATWSGDGSYVSVANVLAYFPASGSEGSPHSNYVRVFEEENSSSPTGWIRRLCQLKRSVVETMGPYEICVAIRP